MICLVNGFFLLKKIKKKKKNRKLRGNNKCSVSTGRSQFAISQKLIEAANQSRLGTDHDKGRWTEQMKWYKLYSQA